MNENDLNYKGIGYRFTIEFNIIVNEKMQTIYNKNKEHSEIP